ncbi:MAG: HesA/MoeB/ThiF family protein [Clostridiales bacterium]|nr:HesA/MoeB/ThiF family protein [Clostridiales bacterium]
MNKRYQRNFNFISEKEFESIRDKKIGIIGLGGLGGNILEMLVRFGFRNIAAVDDDVFDETNLNRQILSNEDNIGKKKSETALKHARNIDKEVNLIVYSETFTYSFGKEMLKDCDMVFDALDNIKTRLLLSAVCDEYGIPLVHGAIDGWFGQVCVMTDHAHVMEHLYKNDSENNSELGNPSFTPAVIAGVQVSEGIKYLLKKGLYLENKVLFIDLLNNMYEIIEI